MTDDQNILAQVRDRIKSCVAVGRAQQDWLVVNGASVSQGIESDGFFARPYTFTESSDSVQAIGPDGQSQQRMQLYSTPGVGVVRTRLRLVLSQDTDNTDLDLHVVMPDGEHVWYGNTALENSGTPDMGVTTGYSPEVFAIPVPAHNRYQVYINCCGGRSETGLTTAQLTLIIDEGPVNKKQETFTIPMHNTGELTPVKSFNW